MAFAPNSRLLGRISCLSVVATCSLTAFTASAGTYQNSGLEQYHLEQAKHGVHQAVGMLTMGAILNPTDPGSPLLAAPFAAVYANMPRVRRP